MACSLVYNSLNQTRVYTLYTGIALITKQWTVNCVATYNAWTWNMVENLNYILKKVEKLVGKLF